ncbi:hypothetical protein EVAR_31328_1 [Eumeta japonica]|uniref:Uncharacterized protein n=1 Tax=Eumeta variegata TaxID=151549 RepID=A0A4C1XXL8_EUMVA|nr:hypothetical protein EVAR_31328_1 [Eumeta japonica]
MRAALIRSASTSVRPPAVGCASSLSCASLPPSSSTNLRRSPPPPAGACAMTARARVWVGDWAPARCQSMDPKDHCHLSRRGRVPDEKTPGHEATISPPSRTCTLKIEGVEDPPKPKPKLIREVCAEYSHAPSNVMYTYVQVDGPSIYCSGIGASVSLSCCSEATGRVRTIFSEL